MFVMQLLIQFDFSRFTGCVLPVIFPSMPFNNPEQYCMFQFGKLLGIFQWMFIITN